jgi:hypothetical protein
MMVVPRTPGPAYANLQGRKPREVGRGSASDAMGISLLGVRCQGALTTSVGSGRRGGELGRSVAIAGTGVAQRRLIDESVARAVATASRVGRSTHARGHDLNCSTAAAVFPKLAAPSSISWENYQRRPRCLIHFSSADLDPKAFC